MDRCRALAGPRRHGALDGLGEEPELLGNVRIGQRLVALGAERLQLDGVEPALFSELDTRALGIKSGEYLGLLRSAQVRGELLVSGLLLEETAIRHR